MKQIFLDVEKMQKRICHSFVGDLLEEGENLILNLKMPKEFIREDAAYYMVSECKKSGETMFLPLLAKCQNTLIFSISGDALSPPTVKFFIGAYSKEDDKVYLIKESKPIYLFVEEKERKTKGEML